MSRIALREDGLLVVDAVLAAADFECLWRDIRKRDFRSVHAQKWDKAWRLCDGLPLRGESIYFDPKGAFGWKGSSYPTRTRLDFLIDAIRRASAAYPDVVGTEGVDWTAIYLAPWFYPVGSALSVHRDSDQRTGSFTFYIHPRWNLHWGGDLHVFPGSSAIADEFLLRNDDEDEQWPARQENSETDDAGISISIPPKPNRLVLIASNRPHRIARVDQNAGTAVRASVAGFFLRHTLV
jgi:hypothetical protein